MTHDSPALERIRNARAGLLQSYPFFGVLSLKLELVETRAIPTAGVTTKHLVFNPDFVMALADGELKGLIAHEVFHLAWCHHARVGSRCEKRWNIAGDYLINDALTEEGLTLPQGALLSKKYTHTTWTTEMVYEDIPQSEVDNLYGQGDGATGHFDSAGAEGSADAGDAEREWMQNVQDAARVAQSAGKLPASIKRLIPDMTTPKADWKQLLRRFITDQVKPRQTWATPNRRLRAATGLYLPGNIKEGMGAIVIGVDTSGSITDQVLARFATEIRAIMGDCEPARVHVIYCDAAVGRVDTFENGEELVMEPVGGGGTDFRPVFAEVEKQGFEPIAGVYLTDLAGTFPESGPGYPVLWAAYGAGGAVAPWGETVVVE